MNYTVEQSMCIRDQMITTKKVNKAKQQWLEWIEIRTDNTAKHKICSITGPFESGKSA